MAAQVRRRVSGATVATLTPGQHLRAEMQRLGLDQASLGETIGVSRQSINNVVNDRQPISRAMAGRLARVTGHASDYWLKHSFEAGGRDDAAQVRVTGLLVQQQILRAIEDGVIGVTPFNRACVRLASLDLTLHSAIKLKKGELVRARTREHVELPLDHLARLATAADIAARGIVVLHAPQIEPRFKGAVQIGLFNASGADAALDAGHSVVSMEILALATAPVPPRGQLRRPRAPRVK